MAVDSNESKSFSDLEAEPPRAQAGIFKMKGAKKAAEKKKNVAAEKGPKEKPVDKEKTEVAPAPQAKTTQSVAPAQGHPFVEQWCQRALDMGVEKLRDEFRQLAKYTTPGMTQNAFNKNSDPSVERTKNRYQDVPCQDQFIVSLLAPAPTDYIHANYVATPMGNRRFICTQGPLDQTVEEFWWMIHQQKVEQIIMLCKTIETGKYKCAQYWPMNVGEKKEFKSGLVVECVAGARPMERDCEIQITMLNVTVAGQTMSVRHLHWTDWPDRGVPPCKLTSLELLSAVRGSKVPIVVHCSAGIGRTGTIVAIEYILEKISAPAAKDEVLLPMPDLVRQIRDMRAYSIQNDLQYLYIHRVMLNYFLDKYKAKYAGILTPENVLKLEKFIKDYNAAGGQ